MTDGNKAKEMDEADVEEGTLTAYMEAEGEVPAEDWTAYLNGRYKQIKDEYKQLVMQKREVEAQKRDDLLVQIHKAFKMNYRARVWAVRNLRASGVSVDDPFVHVVGEVSSAK